MKLVKILKLVFFVTLVALAYINLQMQIYDLAYQRTAKEREIKKLIELNSNVTYTILTLKSANNLGIMMLADNSDMEFIHPNNVVHMLAPEEYLNEGSVNKGGALPKRINPLLSLLSRTAEAQAKTRE